MNTVKRLAIVFLLMSLFSFVYSQEKGQLIKDFTSSDWKQVKKSKAELENIQEGVIPLLIELFDNNEKVKLKNSGSLIYPGAERFFGHGQILDYDIDYISIRAGWLIEDISFNNFGFSGIHLPKEQIVSHIKKTFPAYYNNPANRKRMESAAPEELKKIAWKLSINKVEEWWEAEGADFTRLKALVGALKSVDEKRQVKALFYMRNGTSKCNGLTREYYYEEISKEIVRLSGSDVQRISEHAKLILLDGKLDWLTMKTE